MTSEAIRRRILRRVREPDRDYVTGLLDQLESPWLTWSQGRYPDDSAGQIIEAYPDGNILLDSGLTAWDPIRAVHHLSKLQGNTL